MTVTRSGARPATLPTAPGEPTPAAATTSPAAQPTTSWSGPPGKQAVDGFSGDVPRTPVQLDGGKYSPVPLEVAIHESIAITGPHAELPTPAEVEALKAQGKDAVFSNLALREAHALGDKADQFATREKVQGVVLSIDSYETKDLDNAMSFRREADGTMVVGIHAVDLSAWVRPGSALDAAARRRVETRYLEDQGFTLPMLPLSLSEGKLSLFEGQARLSKSVEMRFSPDGQLVGTRIFRSQLVNEHRLDDADAARAMKGEGRGADPALRDALSSMAQLAAKASGATQPGATMAMDKMLGFYTQLSARVVGDALTNGNLEASFRNQEKANQKSSYGAQALGHAAIGAKAYATWTGPMRRYADLDVHRALDRLIDGKTPSGRVADIDGRMRQAQLDRANKVKVDERLDVVPQLVEVTRKPTP
jgi:hypothetical protein